MFKAKWIGNFLGVCLAGGIILFSLAPQGITQVNNPGVQQSGAVAANDCVKWGPGVGQIQSAGATCLTAASAVTSFNTRTGAVVAATNDYAFSQISGTLGCSQLPNLTGDVTTTNCAAVLATVNSNVGSFGSATQCATITVNGKGLITAASAATCAPAFSSVTGNYTLAQGPSIAANTVLSNWTAGATTPSANTWPACANDGAHALVYVNGTGVQCSTLTATTVTIASGTSAMGTSAIASATCATVVTTAATGTATTDVVQAGFNGDPTAVTGYVPLTSGMLTIIPYPTANNVNFKVCNNTSASITPGAITLNWRVVR